MECSSQDEQIEKIDDYLRSRGHKDEMAWAEIATELSVTIGHVGKLIQDGRLKSRDTRDVAAYIVLHT
jgi:hypothetical protein